MLFLGVDVGGGPKQTYAIKINESEVGHEELNRRTQEREMQIERALGENYRQFAGQLLKGLKQSIKLIKGSFNWWRFNKNKSEVCDCLGNWGNKEKQSSFEIWRQT